MKYLTLLLIITITMAIGVIRAETPAKENIPVKIGYMKVLASENIFIAVEKGYFKEEGLDIELVLMPSGQSGIDALIAGKIDIVHAHPLLTDLNLEYNIPGKIKFLALRYTTTSRDTEGCIFIVKADSGINSLADLKGKKLVVPPSKASVVAAKVFLQKFFDPNDITIINLPPADHLIALQSGGADAIMTMEPIAAVALVQGGFRELDAPSRAELIANPFYSLVTTISSEFVKKYPENAKKVQRAFAKSTRFLCAAENETERRAIIKKYTGVTAEVAQKIRLQPEHISSEVDKKALQTAADFLFENGLMKGHVDTSNMLF